MQSFLTVGTRSTTLPVPLAELEAHLSILPGADDARLTALEWAAVDWIERQINRYLVPTTVTETFLRFPTLFDREGQWVGYFLPLYPYPLLNTPTGLPWHWGELQRMELGRSPVQSVTSFTYYDVNNTVQALAQGTDYYFVNPSDRPAFVQPVNIWPVPYYRPDSVQLTYQAGYTTLPGTLNAAIKLLVAAWNENREAFNSTPTQVANIPIGMDALLQAVSTGGYY